MPDLQFASVAPGLQMFNANMARADYQRRLDEADAMRRIQFDEAQAADAAERKSAAGYFDQARGAATGQPSAFPAAPPPAPAAPAAPAPDTYRYNPLEGSPPAPAAPPPAPAPAPSARAPAIASFSTQPQPSPMRGIVDTLASAPGTGAALMTMVTQDIAGKEKRRIEGNKAVLGYLRDGDVDLAREAARAYGIGIPDWVWGNKNALMQLRVGANIAKTAGLKDEYAVHFLGGYFDGLSQGQQPTQAAMGSLKAMPRDAFEVKHVVAGMNNDAIGVGKYGQVKKLGFKMRPRRTAAGVNGETAQQRNLDYKIKLWISTGIPREVATKFALNPRAIITPLDVSRVEAQISKETKDGVNPRYTTEAQIHAAAMARLSAIQESVTGNGVTPPAAGNDPLGIRSAQ